MIRILSILTFIVAFPSFAADVAIDLSEYARPALENVTGNLVRNGGFENGASGWANIDGTDRSAGNHGINQTGGLSYRRSALGSSVLVSQPVKLIPGRRYRFGAMIRTRGVTGEGAGICVEGLNKGTYAGGAYVHHRTGDSDWNLLSGEFTPDGEFPEATYSLALYLRKDATGEAWFDDVSLYELAPRLDAECTLPTHHTLRPGQELELHTFYEGESGAGHLLTVDIEQRGKVLKRQVFPAGTRHLKLSPGEPETGEFTVVCRHVDPKTRRILAESKVPMTFAPVPAESLSANAAIIDADRRLLVGGKPYMPLGLYTQQVDEAELELLAASPFNCIMPYPGPEMKLSNSKLVGDAAVAEVLDLCAEKGIKVLFSLKDLYRGEDDKTVVRLVERFKNHPALLAWYICDEASVEKIPQVAKRRRLVNRLDPFHPTWSVFYQWPDFYRYVSCQDVFGNDPYPINNRDDAHILGTDHSTRAAEALDMPLWSVPQIHHTGLYNSKWKQDPIPYFSTLRAPNEEEMNTICLLEAMRGAKGFVMYSLFDLKRGPDKLQFERRWPEVCRVAERLKKLEPYLLSTSPAPAVANRVSKGKIYARAFRAPDGSTRVLVCQVSSGAGEAELVIGDGETGYLSENGRTVEVSPGVYRFFGTDTTFDLLRSP